MPGFASIRNNLRFLSMRVRDPGKRCQRKGLFVRLHFGQGAGFSLLEVALAMMIVSVVLITAISSALSALRWQVEADRMALAMSLVQTKMAEIRSNRDLSTEDKAGEFDDEDSIYYRYRWKTSVREENLDIGELLESSFGDLPLGDQLPAGIQNSGAGEESAAKKGLFSGGIPILKISVTVEYPKGRGAAYGNYHVESIQRSKRSRLYQKN